MAKVKKRALWGYSPESVEQAVARCKELHEANCADLRKDMERLERECSELTAKIARLRAESESPEPDEDMARQLLDEHYAATANVMEAQTAYRETLDRQKEIERWVIERQQSLLSKVKNQLIAVSEHNEKEDR
ncbi:MAG TPA: hypothetical protein VMS09_07365 [Paenibacillus sp.]|uniref:hypothetical protein n=1 Tax=Paenibacillus sp. TaxID=58172 RepID=UPI002C9A4EBE|nr:hypothetical protein [Paenibacillus sp.]HUC91830.1 hypothetical protein [Paenibacillus sp.]